MNAGGKLYSRPQRRPTFFIKRSYGTKGPKIPAWLRRVRKNTKSVSSGAKAHLPAGTCVGVEAATPKHPTRPLVYRVGRRGSRLDHAAAGFLDQVFDDRSQVAGFLVDAELAFGARAFIQNGVDVFDGAAAAQIVHHVFYKLEQLGGKLAHGHFRFFADIDEFALDAVARGAPFIFFDQRAAVQPEAHVSGVQAVQFDDDRLRERGNGHRFFHFGGHIAHAKLQRSKRGVRPNVPPDFLSSVDAIQLTQRVGEILVSAPGFKLLGNAGAREAAEDGGAERFQAGVASHPEGRTSGEREQVRKEIEHHVHHVDGGLLVGHGHVDVHTEDQE